MILRKRKCKNTLIMIAVKTRTAVRNSAMVKMMKMKMNKAWVMNMSVKEMKMQRTAVKKTIMIATHIDKYEYYSKFFIF